MLPSEPPIAAVWSPRSQGIGVALWTSFLVACLETMIVFAFVGPATLGFDGLSPSLAALRPMLYGGGSFLSWSFAFIAAGLTAHMTEMNRCGVAAREPAGRVMTTEAVVASTLYAAQEKIYAREVSGRFAQLRIASVVLLLGVFHGLPWPQWNGRQAVLFDLPARKFFIFGLTLFS